MAGRRGWVIAASVVAMGVLVTLAGLPLYVFPPAGDVDHADLVYVIGPPTTQRVDLAERLLDDGAADALLISVPDDGPQSASELRACDDPRVRCEHPDPFTTKGEAALLAQLNAGQETNDTVVVTFTPHVARTRFIFERCYDGPVTVVGVDQDLSLGDWAYQYVYQTAAFAKALVTPCA